MKNFILGMFVMHALHKQAWLFNKILDSASKALAAQKTEEARSSSRSDLGPKIGHARVRYDDVSFSNYEEAKLVLETLKQRIENYGWASVSDYFALSAVPDVFEDTKIGWNDLDKVEVVEDYNRYKLDLPKPELIRAREN